MTKIAFIIDDLGLGGAQRQLLELVKGLDRSRFQPVLFSLSEQKTALKEEIEKTESPLVLLDQQGKFSFPVLYKLWKGLQNFSPTIVHTYLFTADFYGRIAAKLAGVPILISSIRSTEPNKKRHYIWADRYLATWCDAIIVNAFCIGGLIVVREKIEKSKIFTIHNGVDLLRFDLPGENGLFRRSLGIPEGAVVLGTVGRLGPEKDHPTLLEAFSQIRRRGHDAFLLVVGDGTLRSVLVKQAERLGIGPYVRWLGPRNDIPEILRSLDLFLLPSRYEGCPNVVLEAMAAQICVVATAVGGTPEVIRHGETGVLVKPGEAKEMVEAVCALLENPQQILEMGREARRAVSESFSVGRMVEKTESLYKDLLKRKGMNS